MKPQRTPDEGDDEPRAAESEASAADTPASEVADLRFHLLKTRLRIAVESLETAERLLTIRGTQGEESHGEARRLIETAKHELESLKALIRGEGSSSGVL
jgi:hypothetical protein